MNIQAFKNKVIKFAEESQKAREHANNESNTKASLICPFIEMLGYSVKPPELTSEHEASHIKKGKKEAVDYALHYKNQPILIIECKKHKEKLDAHVEKLKEYFNAFSDKNPKFAKFALLTNGVDYHFFNYIAENRIGTLADAPFLKFNIDDYSSCDVEMLFCFSKGQFDPKEVRRKAKELGLLRKRSTPQKAIKPPGLELDQKRSSSDVTKNARKAYEAVCAILSQMGIPRERVKYKESNTRFMIGLDNRKRMLCRLHIKNGTLNEIELFDGDIEIRQVTGYRRSNGKAVKGEVKKGTFYPLDEAKNIVEAIHKYSVRLIQTVKKYDPDTVKNASKVSQNTEPKPAHSKPVPPEPAPKNETGTKGTLGWFYYNEAKKQWYGPVSSETLIDLATTGKIQPETPVKTPGGQEGVARRLEFKGKRLVFGKKSE